MTLKSTPIGHIDVHMEIRGSGSVNNEQHGCEIALDRRPGLCTEIPGGALASIRLQRAERNGVSLEPINS